MLYKNEEDKVENESIFLEPIVDIDKVTQHNNLNDFATDSKIDDQDDQCTDCVSD